MINDIKQWLKSLNITPILNVEIKTIQTAMEDNLQSAIHKSNLPSKIETLLLSSYTVRIRNYKDNPHIFVTFDRNKMYRDSLYKEKYDGADTDVLYNNGWHAKNYVYGTNSAGFRYRSKKDFNSTNFIQEAVSLTSQQLGINEKFFYINDIYDLYNPYDRVTHGIGNYIFGEF